MSLWNRKKPGGRHESPAEQAPAREDHASPAGRAGVLFVTEDEPHAGPPPAPPRRAWRRPASWPAEPYVEVYARTPQPQPAASPEPVPEPRPYVPVPPRRQYISVPRMAKPTGPVDVPDWLYPGYDGTAEEYARLMRLCDRLTGTTSRYSNPKAWPQHALTAPQAGEAA